MEKQRKENDELLSGLKAGNKGSYEKAFFSYYPSLCSYAFNLINDMDTSRDICQDIFVKLYERKNSIEIKSSLKSYLYRSVYNACLNYLKSKQIRELHHQEIIHQADTIDYEDAILLSELREHLMEEVNNLPRQCQKIFVMNRFEGLKNAEIAEKLNISKRTVETQISKALKTLRQKLAHYLPTIITLIKIFEIF